MGGAPQKNNEHDLNASSMKNGDPNIDNKFDEHSLHTSDCGGYGDDDKEVTTNLNLKTPTHTG